MEESLFYFLFFLLLLLFYRSLSHLGCPSLPLLYLHSPDPKHGLEETLRGCDNLHKKGKIHALGLSNYTVEEVRRMKRKWKNGGEKNEN